MIFNISKYPLPGSLCGVLANHWQKISCLIFLATLVNFCTVRLDSTICRRHWSLFEWSTVLESFSRSRRTIDWCVKCTTGHWDTYTPALATFHYKDERHYFQPSSFHLDGNGNFLAWSFIPGTICQKASRNPKTSTPSIRNSKRNRVCVRPKGISSSRYDIVWFSWSRQFSLSM